MSQPTPTTSAGAVVIDANILVAICAKEPGEPTAKAALADYVAKTWAFYAPGAILTEVLFILCRKLQNGEIDAAKHKKAVEDFNDYMSAITPSPQGDIRLFFAMKRFVAAIAVFIPPLPFTLPWPKTLPITALLNSSRLINARSMSPPTTRQP